MAARREGRWVDVSRLVEFCRAAIAGHRRTLLIEGVGGVMVPLDDGHTVVDWMVALNIPVLVVTGSYLGSLSHILTALTALQQRGLAVSGVVVNETAGSTVPLADTVETLSRFAGPVVALPRLPADIPDHPAFAKLASLL
jgi:dethiobiotin synthetase